MLSPRICLLLVLSFGGLVPATVTGDDERLSRNKRTEIDLQTCIDNFNVHRDKIIRTQDSQLMGAKYLNEIDLGSREECLRLCCETQDCDVFVFEEKNSGSCYLFRCGPPEDFKCKFTHHVNYSSGILSINRRLPDLESQIKLTKHVQDLTKLRKPDLELIPVVPDVSKNTPTTTPPTVITKEVMPAEKQVEVRKCSRYQFECRSTGECIAIYNACDGIPQCADGSDEGPELGCPSPDAVANAPAPTTPPPAPKAILKPPVHLPAPAAALTPYGREEDQFQQEQVKQQQQQPKLQAPSGYQTIYRPPQTQPGSQGAFPSQDPEYVRPEIDHKTAPERPQFEPVAPAPHYENMRNDWGLLRQELLRQQGVAPYHQAPYRKENVVAHNDNQISQIQYPVYQGRLPDYHSDYYKQTAQQENWPPADESRYPVPQLQVPENQVPILPAKAEETGRIAESIEHSKKLVAETTTNSKHVQEKLAHDLKHSKENMDHGLNQKVILMQTDRLRQATAQDGPSSVPRGAILSLTLGLILTGVMAILLGCRLRVVRRRLRKGGKGYAHDADYLVNGMYL